jgi:dipicolinate synthase subunit A
MLEAVRFFLEAGARVRVAGQVQAEQQAGLTYAATAAEALTGAEAAILPVQGVSPEGKVFTLPGAPECYIDDSVVRRMRRGAPVFVGIGNPYLRETCAEAGVPLLEYREADEFAIWNAIPSAEGAVQMAMEATPFTIFGSRTLVLGFGRTGKAIALLLRGLFSDVTVAARKDLDFARIWAAGYKCKPWPQLNEAVREADIIFNTVPAMVLPHEVLAEAPAHCAIIDVASPPGGTDFAAAQQLGLTAKLAPGLPGIVAPVTAGKIIADLILRHLENLAGREGER